MADMDLTIDVNTTQAQRNVQQLENRVSNLSESFSGLRNAIAGIALGALISKSMQLADQIQDVSDATGIARENILAFGQAVQEAGGTFEGATNGLNVFIQRIDDAVEGGQKTRDAFEQVGVSLRDLETLSERALLAKTLKGLEQIEDKAKAAALGTEIFGKAFKGVAGQNVGAVYSQAVVEAQRYSQTIKSVSDLQGKLDRTFVNLQLSILKALEPLTNFLNKIPQDKLDKMIEGFIQLGAAAVAIAATAKTLQMLGTALAFVGAAFASFKIGIMLVKDGLGILSLAQLVANKGFYDLGKTIGITLKVFKDYSVPAIAAAATFSTKITELGKTGAMLAKRMGFAAAAFVTMATGARTALGALGLMAAGLVRMIPFVGTIAAGMLALNEILKATTNISLAGWFDKGAEAMERWVTNSFPKVAAALNWLGEKLGMAPSPMQQQAADPRAALRKQEIGDYEKINSLLAAQKQEEEKAHTERKARADAAAQALKQYQLGQRQELENMQQGMRLMVARVAFERDLIIQNGQLVRLTEDQVEEARLLQQLDESRTLEVTRLRQQIEALRISASQDAAAQGKILVLQQQIKSVNAAYLEQQERLPGALRSLQAAQATVKAIEEDRARTLDNITQAYDNQVNRTQTLANQMKDVGKEINESLFATEMIGKSPLEQAIAKIRRDAEQAALAAKRAFAETFEGDLGPEREMDLLRGLDAIQNKFQELAKVQADNVRANFEYSRSWAGGWNEAFREYMMNATNAATTARDIFGAVTNNMNSQIDNFVSTGKFKFNDFATSIIQDLLRIELRMLASKALSPILSGIGAGVSKILGFAEGGSPPINKPSIVGEKGPELFIPKTAGTIVPNNALGGQQQVTNNYITNNISAVDAKSVAQLFAENRRTLLGTMRLAEKELSYR